MALIVALRRPDLVRKLVIIGTAVNLAGGTPFARAMSTQMTVDHLPPMLVAAYGALSPDGPEHLPVVFDRLSRALAETTLELADLARIPAPTLIMAADDDLVSISHLEAMRDALPDAQLAIVPGTSHALPLEKPALTAQLILEFLDDEQVDADDAHPAPLRLKNRALSCLHGHENGLRLRDRSRNGGALVGTCGLGSQHARTILRGAYHAARAAATHRFHQPGRRRQVAADPAAGHPTRRDRAAAARPGGDRGRERRSDVGDRGVAARRRRRCAGRLDRQRRARGGRRTVRHRGAPPWTGGHRDRRPVPGQPDARPDRHSGVRPGRGAERLPGPIHPGHPGPADHRRGRGPARRHPARRRRRHRGRRRRRARGRDRGGRDDPVPRGGAAGVDQCRHLTVQCDELRRARRQPARGPAQLPWPSS